jgi:hypothetical protein
MIEHTYALECDNFTYTGQFFYRVKTKLGFSVLYVCDTEQVIHFLRSYLKKFWL